MQLCLARSFYKEFKQVPAQVYQLDQMIMLGHLTDGEALEIAFNLNMDMFRGNKLPSVEYLQTLLKARNKQC